jgi:outer membrane receptor protein involved in Fe transport
VAVYGYDYRFEDLVERYQTATDFFFFRNRGDSRIRGAEAELQATLPWKLGLELTAHQLSGEARDDDAALDSIPVPTMTVRLRRDVGKGHGWIRGGFYGRLDDPGPTEQERPGFSLLDAGIGIRPSRQVEIDLLGRNLLDKAYLVTPDARATLAPGRTGIVTVTLVF